MALRRVVPLVGLGLLLSACVPAATIPDVDSFIDCLTGIDGTSNAASLYDAYRITAVGCMPAGTFAAAIKSNNITATQRDVLATTSASPCEVYGLTASRLSFLSSSFGVVASASAQLTRSVAAAAPPLPFEAAWSADEVRACAARCASASNRVPNTSFQFSVGQLAHGGEGTSDCLCLVEDAPLADAAAIRLGTPQACGCSAATADAQKQQQLVPLVRLWNVVVSCRGLGLVGLDGGGCGFTTEPNGHLTCGPQRRRGGATNQTSLCCGVRRAEVDPSGSSRQALLWMALLFGPLVVVCCLVIGRQTRRRANRQATSPGGNDADDERAARDRQQLEQSLAQALRRSPTANPTGEPRSVAPLGSILAAPGPLSPHEESVANHHHHQSLLHERRARGLATRFFDGLRGRRHRTASVADSAEEAAFVTRPAAVGGLASEPSSGAVVVPLRSEEEAEAMASVVMHGLATTTAPFGRRSVNPLGSTSVPPPPPTAALLPALPGSAVHDVHHVDDEVLNCPICLAPNHSFSSAATVCILPCEHQAHGDCIRQYIQYELRRYRDPRCPICQFHVRRQTPPPRSMLVLPEEGRRRGRESTTNIVSEDGGEEDGEGGEMGLRSPTRSSVVFSLL